MKCTIPEISWHNREPVLSVDIHPVSNKFYKLASCGGDSHVLIWQMNITESGAVKQEVIADLTRHQKAVNCVRWSPDGRYLASADDDANIIIWQLKSDSSPLLEGDSGNKELWVVFKVLRGHKEDIYDLCWSLDSSKLFSGSVDNTAILWDISKGKMDHILTDHKGFVQGVAWDPKNQYLTSISTDRVCRLFDKTGKHVKARLQKGKVPVPLDHFLNGKEVKFFHDDTFKSFFRRLEFSPDGSLLVVPSGRMEADDCKKVLCATVIFSMDNFLMPSALLPLPNQCSTVVRFCPILFTLREDGPEPAVKLPYRMVFAVGTDHDVILYDTQQKEPFARFHEIHYTRLTDIAWSEDGLLLIASSTDGFCSLVTFELGELGTVYVKENYKAEEAEGEISEKVEKREEVNKMEKKKSSFLQQWALNTPKKPSKKQQIQPEVIEILDDESDDEDDDGFEYTVTDNNIIDDDGTEKLPASIKDEIKNIIPTRASFKAISSSTENGKHTEERKKSTEETTDYNNQLEDGKGKINILIPRRKDPKLKQTQTKHSNLKQPNRTEDNYLIPQDKSKKTYQSCTGIKGGNDKQGEKNSDNSLDENDHGILPRCIKNEIWSLIPSRSSTLVTKSEESNGSDAKPIEVRKHSRNRTNNQSHSTEMLSNIVLRSSDTNETKTHAHITDNNKLLGLDRALITNEKDERKISIDSGGIKSQNIMKNISPQSKEKRSKVDTSRKTNVSNEKQHVEINDSNNEVSSKKEKNNFKETQNNEIVVSQKTYHRSKENDIVITNEENLDEEKQHLTEIEVQSRASITKRRIERTSKNKTTPNARKKLCSTPPNKNNPLLNFLKRSDDKNKRSGALTIIDLTNDEARSAWNETKRTREDERDSLGVTELEDDHTEDFCLRLEDTRDEVQNGTSKDQTEKEKPILKSSGKEIRSKLDDKKVPRRVPLITLSSPKSKRTLNSNI